MRGMDLDSMMNMAVFGKIGNLARSGIGISDTLTLVVEVVMVFVCFYLAKCLQRLMEDMDSDDSPISKMDHILEMFSIRRTHTRIITNTVTNHAFGCLANGDDNNKLLQKAILMHINRLRGKNRFPNSNLKLTATQCSESRFSYYYDDKADKNAVVDAAIKEMAQYDIVCIPPNDRFVSVFNSGNDEVLFCKRCSHQDHADGKRTTNTDTYVIKGISTTTKSAQRVVDDFVQTAFEKYRDDMASQRDDTRYMYFHYRSFDDRDTLLYKRYPLTDTRTFDTFYHPEKDDILHWVNNFSSESGKFAIPGYPKKLGFMLYGPPGTGKTTFVKALAHHTKRHIVCVGLDKIKTNKELMDIMHDCRYEVENEDIAHRLAMSDTIFLLEDVDALDSVARRDYVSTKCKPTEDTKAAGPATKLDTAKLMWKEEDALSLAGILNVMDGILDAPNRIVVMTSNHPEDLDPALTRPGRINRTIYMGYINHVEANEMIRRYYGDSMDDLVAGILEILQITPAKLESMCGEFETLDSLLDALPTACG